MIKNINNFRIQEHALKKSKINSIDSENHKCISQSYDVCVDKWLNDLIYLKYNCKVPFYNSHFYLQDENEVDLCNNSVIIESLKLYNSNANDCINSQLCSFDIYHLRRSTSVLKFDGNSKVFLLLV